MDERKLVEYHVHSNCSVDDKSSIIKIYQKGYESGINEIEFTDHMDFEPRDLGYGFFDYERHSLEIDSGRAVLSDQLVIRKGSRWTINITSKMK